MTALVACQYPVGNLRDLPRYITYEMSEYLLDHGADPNLHPDKNKNVLESVENEKLAKLLIERGATVDNVVTSDGLGLLQIAAVKNRVHVIKLFVQHGANINSYGAQVALHFAVISLNYECAIALIKLGADVNMLDAVR